MDINRNLKIAVTVAYPTKKNLVLQKSLYFHLGYFPSDLLENFNNEL